MQAKWVIFVLVGAALLSACGDGSSSGSSTTAPVNLNSTSFATLAPTPSTLAVATSLPTEGQVSAAAQEYTILPTDTSRQKVADLYGITVAALDQANVSTPGYSAFYPTLKIVIPAGAKVPSASATVTTTTIAGDTTAVSTPVSAVTTTTVATDANGCTTGSYTIVAGDLPGRVAKSFDVTLDQLNAANANTSGYKSFIVGTTIVIPCT